MLTSNHRPSDVMTRGETRGELADNRFASLEVTKPTPSLAPERRLPELDLLLLEFSHRINNEFAAIIGTVSIASARTKNAETRAVLSTVEERLHSYAQVHQALRMPESGIEVDAAAYLRNLCEAICRSKLEDKGIELILVDRPLKMSSERCWRLGLIVVELITNAARHAFSERGGTVRVDISELASVVRCCVTDNGRAGALVRPGCGSKIVRALAQGLGGTFEQRFGADGAAATLTIPCDAQI